MVRWQRSAGRGTASTTKRRNGAGEGGWEAAHRGPGAGSMPPGAAARALGGGDAEILLEGGAVGLEPRAVGLVHHHAALQNDRAVGHAEDFLCVLLNHDGGS